MKNLILFLIAVPAVAFAEVRERKFSRVLEVNPCEMGSPSLLPKLKVRAEKALEDFVEKACPNSERVSPFETGVESPGGGCWAGSPGTIRSTAVFSLAAGCCPYQEGTCDYEIYCQRRWPSADCRSN